MTNTSSWNREGSMGYGQVSGVGERKREEDSEDGFEFGWCNGNKKASG